MQDFRNQYKTMIESIDFPQYEGVDFFNRKKTKVIIKNRRLQAVFSIFLLALVILSVSGTTVYAISNQRKVFIKEKGYKIDDSISDEDIGKELIIEYISDDEQAEIYISDNIYEYNIGEQDEIPLTSDFHAHMVNQIDEAEKIVSFEIIEPNVDDLQLREIYVYTPETWIENCNIVILNYGYASENITVTYRQFGDSWSYETDFRENFVENEKYVNEFGIEFTIIKGFIEDRNSTIYEATAAFENMLVILNCENISEEQLKIIINSMNLNKYK